MSKPVSPLLGYNNNVRHKNRVFHIQTEDSGIKHPHIITHLFMDGGRILKSIKRSYAEHVGADKMQDTVKQMMKEQHKAMFIALRDGQFDGLLEEGLAAREKAAAEASARNSAPAAANDKASSGAPVKASRPPVEGGDDVDMVPQTTRTHDKPPDETAERTASSDAPSGKRASVPPPRKPASSPPKRTPSAPPKKPASLPPGRGKSPSEGRYAAARPAAIFGQSKPQHGSSIFGEDLISDKSLDEVILSYLAEDLEPPAEKK
jgi:hypothetical protein